MKSTIELLRWTASGFYCPPGDFYIDPWMPVPRAVITHAHGDHFAVGCRSYLVAEAGKTVFRQRLPIDRLQTQPYGQPLSINGVQVSFHPAGHLLGSAQIRLEYGGQVAVFSGDYKLQPDPTCLPFEPVPCHLFVTEATFALPIYRWPDSTEVFAEINAWWRANQAAGKPSLLYAYVLGKAQRLLAGVNPSIGPILTHGAVERMNRAYRQAGVNLPATQPVATAARDQLPQALILAPMSARGTPWTRRFGLHASAFASGWMRIRGTRRRRAIDQGFVISDHADWPGLLSACRATGAEQIWTTHGYTNVLARYLNEQGQPARAWDTRYEGEREESDLSGEPAESNDPAVDES